MQKESLGQDICRSAASNRLRFGGALLAVGALAVSGIPSCNDEVLNPDQSLTPDTTHTLTLDEMGADAGVLAVPKIFSCGSGCLSPEDREGLIDDVERQVVLDGKIPPKIFTCNVKCIGFSTEDAPTFDLTPDH